MPSAELQEIIEMLQGRSLRRQEQNPTLAEMRAAMDAMAQRFQVLDDVSTEGVDANGVPAEWVVASNAEANRVMLYLHGGGYVVGSIASHRGLAASLSRASRGRVLPIDYRLAPEHPFPAAVEDALAAYRWLIENGGPPAQITIAGDSAGGGLTVATLVALRDSGDPLPAAGICISPWVDMEGIGESMETRASLDPMVQREVITEMAGLYLNGADPRSPLAAPLYADLQGIPALLILVGAAETLFDDSTRLVERARNSGVDAIMEPWDDMIHVWPLFAPFLPEGQQAVERIGKYVQERTSPVRA